jgi:4-hydroxy-tetrahydrodipicolinate synthase
MTTNTRPRGVMGACLTPFTAEGTIDEPALAAQLDHLAQDSDLIAIGAVEAAEYTTLDADVREGLLRTGIRMLDGRVPSVAGASGGSIAESLRWLDIAADAGATYGQVLLPCNPWGGEPSPDELVAYMGAIVERSPLPIVAYQNPASGADPAIPTYVQIARMDGIVAFKESDRNIAKLTRLIEEVDRAGHAAYFTTMQPMLITLIMGGSGATMPPPGTRIAAHLRDAFDAGDLVTATAWARVLSHFPAVWGRFGLAATMKAAMRHAGVDIGGPRAPFQGLPPEADAHLGRFIAGCGILDGQPADEETLRRLARP